MTALEGGETIAAMRYLYGKLETASAGINVYPGAAPRSSAMPYILVQSWPRPDGGDTTAFGAVRVMAKLRYLVKVVSATLAEAEPIARAVDRALVIGGNDSAQQDGYTLLNLRRSEPFEMPTVEGDEQYWQTGGYYDLEVTAGV